MFHTAFSLCDVHATSVQQWQEEPKGHTRRSRLCLRWKNRPKYHLLNFCMKKVIIYLFIFNRPISTNESTNQIWKLGPWQRCEIFFSFPKKAEGIPLDSGSSMTSRSLRVFPGLAKMHMFLTVLTLSNLGLDPAANNLLCDPEHTT